jgi:type I restriction enzyme S subunit
MPLLSWSVKLRIIENIRLGDIAKVISGFAFKSSEFSDEGVPVVKIANIRVGFLDLDGAQRVNPSYLEKLADKYKVKSGDVLISLTGSHITQPNSVVGRVARASESVPACLLNQRAGKVILNDKDRCDLGFLYYYLTLASLRGDIAAMASGAASQANVSPAQVETLSIDLPPRDEQIRVSSILAAYDDLIENNTRRIEILEEMARRLYEEWFVQFRFPGYEEGVFENDMLPQGWVYSQLSEIASYISRGISPKYDEEASCRVINQKCIRNQRLDVQLSRRQNKKVPAEKLIQLGDVLINSTGVGTLGRVAQVHEVLEDVTVDSHVTIARAGDSVDVDYFGSTLLSLQHFFELQGVGSTGQTELSRSRIAEANVIVPPYELQAQFGKLIRPMRVLGTWLAKKNSNLRAQRDLLLPKLISGEIDVSDIPMPT